MSNSCADNKVAIGSMTGYNVNTGDADATPANVNDFTYIIGSASEFRIPLISTVSSTCATYSQLFIYDTASNTWID